MKKGKRMPLELLVQRWIQQEEEEEAFTTLIYELLWLQSKWVREILCVFMYKQTFSIYTHDMDIQCGVVDRVTDQDSGGKSLNPC